MTTLIELSNGNTVTAQEFKALHRNLVFSGEFPPQALLSSVGARLVKGKENPATVHSERDRLLSQTDWMALSDTTMSPAWTTYRQALRDVTAQPGYPFAV